MYSWENLGHLLADLALLVLSLCAQWLHEWQTLAGALIALFAAQRTIRVMRKQMSSEAARHNDALRRRKLSARAQMPDALSEIGSYLRSVGDCLSGISATMPDDPSAAITSLKQVIEHIDDSAAERIFELVSWYQVLRARNEADFPAPINADYSEALYGAILMQAFVSSLFDYARNEAQNVDTSQPSADDMMQALQSVFPPMHRAKSPEFYDGVKEMIARRHPTK